MDIAEVRSRFAELVRLPQGEFRLAEGALLLAQEEYLDLSVPAQLARIDGFADTVRQRLGMELDPRQIVAMINTLLFDEEGFRGNQEDYYDPRNSFVNEVLERRLGIPITLSVLYIEMGRLVGLPIAGVGMPGHFIVQYTAQPEQFWIDPFDRGRVLTYEDCKARLQQLYGRQLPWRDAYLQAISDHDILRRMLNNLKMIYVRRNDYPRALRAIERILLITPELPTEVRDKGLVHYQLGHLQAALYDLQRYLELFHEAPDAPAIEKHIATLRRQLED